MNSLRSIFESTWLDVIKATATTHSFELSAKNIPIVPLNLVVDDLCMTKHLHLYGGFPADVVSIEADKTTLGCLSLAIFSTIFHPIEQPTILSLTHERSTIKQLIVEASRYERTSGSGLKEARPVSFSYWSEQVDRHPWTTSSPEKYSKYHFPCISLDLAKGFLRSYADLEFRSVAKGFGSLQGTSLFAELLLNASQPSNKAMEFQLECECGFRGVAPGSAEIEIWLPGSLGNLDHDVSPDA